MLLILNASQASSVVRVCDCRTIYWGHKDSILKGCSPEENWPSLVWMPSIDNSNSVRGGTLWFCCWFWRCCCCGDALGLSFPPQAERLAVWRGGTIPFIPLKIWLSLSISPPLVPKLNSMKLFLSSAAHFVYFFFTLFPIYTRNLEQRYFNNNYDTLEKETHWREFRFIVFRRQCLRSLQSMIPLLIP